MSHGPAEESSEPNLTPLLDMVLQLVMFFMMVANFSMEQVNEDIKLPSMQSARPMDKVNKDVMYLNLNQHGQMVITGQEIPLTTVPQMEFYLHQQVKDYREAAKLRGEDGTELKTLVIIRAHRDSDYGQVYNLLRLCKNVGYRNLQLRALTQAKQG